MDDIKVALLQMDVCSDVDTNLRTAEKLIKEAAENKADFVLLPEMFCCLYTSDSFVANREPKGGRIYTTLKKAAKENRVYLVGGSMPEEEGDKIYNTSFIFDREGNQIGRHRKVHLFDIDVEGGQHFHESDTFTPGDSYTVFDTEFGKMGVEICFDLRFVEIARMTALAGAQVIFVPGAFNMTTGPAHWETHFRGRALDNQVYMCGCAPARDENGPYISWGNSIITSPWGDIVAKLDEKAAVLYMDLDLDKVRSVRDQLPIIKARRTDLYDLNWN